MLAILLPYARAFRRRQARDQDRKHEAVALGIDRPVAQYPFVDPTRCIGCGACVAACPEGDVLGVVAGTATVINGLRCVGHGRCEEACPVGAIAVGLGDLKGRADIPRTDAWSETDVPGLFLAGELAGLALVRNAVAQGRLAVERIADRVERARPSPRDRSAALLDLVIIGAGPAGLSAALAAVERRLSYVVLEQESDLGGSILHYPRRKLVLLQPLELPLHGRIAREEYSKEAFLELMQGLVAEHRLDLRFGEKALAVDGEAGGFAVRTRHATYRARAVVMALGRRGTPRKLGVPGEDLGKVMYRLIDADSYRDQRILVVGGGDSAVEAAVGLSREGRNQVTLAYRREKLVRIKRKNQERLQPLVDRGRIRLIFRSEVLSIAPAKVRLRSGQKVVDLDNDYVFVFAGGEPPFAFLREAGVRFGQEVEAPQPV